MISSMTPLPNEARLAVFSTSSAFLRTNSANSDGTRYASIHYSRHRVRVNTNPPSPSLCSNNPPAASLISLTSDSSDRPSRARPLHDHPDHEHPDHQRPLPAHEHGQTYDSFHNLSATTHTLSRNDHVCELGSCCHDCRVGRGMDLEQPGNFNQGEEESRPERAPCADCTFFSCPHQLSCPFIGNSCMVA